MSGTVVVGMTQMQNLKQNLIYYKNKEQKAQLSRIPKILNCDKQTKQNKTRQDYG